MAAEIHRLRDRAANKDHDQPYYVDLGHIDCQQEGLIHVTDLTDGDPQPVCALKRSQKSIVRHTLELDSASTCGFGNGKGGREKLRIKVCSTPALPQMYRRIFGGDDRMITVLVPSRDWGDQER